MSHPTSEPVRVPEACDVLVVGAGVAGMATALGLKDLSPDRAVTLLDAGVRQRPLHDEVLAESARTVLQSWRRSWQDVLAQDARTTGGGTLSAWDGPELRRGAPLDVAGRHVDKPALAELLAETACRRGVTLARPARLVDVDASPADGGWNVEVEIGGRTSRSAARFLVDASGHQAYLARRLGAKKVRFDRLVGAFVVFPEGRPKTNWDLLVEACREGFWYVARRRRAGGVVAAFMSDADLAREMRVGDRETWLRLFAAGKVSDCVETLGHDIGPPSIRALDSHRLDRVMGPRWLAVGDAAATGDLLAADGITQALESGQRAASAIVDDLAGRRTGLHRYQRIVQQRFEQRLDQRRKLYALERRFPTSPFWGRRQEQLSIDPDQMLLFTESVENRNRVDALGMYLPGEQLQRLCSLCVAPRLAQAVVSAFREHDTRSGAAAVSERRTFLTLQYLVDQGLMSAE